MSSVTTDMASEVLGLLARRDELRVVVIDAPVGYGQSELLRAALREPRPEVPDRIVHLPDGPLDARRAAAAVLAAVDADPVELGDDPVGAVGRALDRVGPVVLVVEHLHRGGQGALDFFGDLAQRSSSGVHLVLCGTELGSLGARAAQDAVDSAVVDRSHLAAPADPVDDPVLSAWPLGAAARRDGEWNRIDAALADAFELDVDEATRALVQSLVALEVRDRDMAEAVAAALGADLDERALRRLPLVAIDDSSFQAHRAWQRVIGDVPVPAETAAAAGEAVLARGDVAAAGRVALVGRSATLLRAVVRAALQSQPPRVGADDLRSWTDADLLRPDDPHSWWLRATNGLAHGMPLSDAFELLVRAATAFRAADDHDAEIACSMAAAIVARRRDDVASIVGLAGRAGELFDLGVESARGPALLARALVHQMSGDPAAAIALLDQVDPDALGGDWGAQVVMMRGTNLLLLDRRAEAIESYARAIGLGSDWSCAVALGLMGSARWLDGDWYRSVEDVAEAERLAATVPAPTTVLSLRALRCLMLAARGDADAAPLLTEVRAAGSLSGDNARVVELAGVLIAIQDGDDDAARAAVASMDAPDRATTSTPWLVALQTALLDDGEQRWRATVDRHQVLQGPLLAGIEARAHLDGGPSPSPRSWPHLPARWCAERPSLIEVRLLGGAELLVDGRTVAHRRWDRQRVRELCLHLSIVTGASRETVAQRLWPDLAGDAAARNLRVTLSYRLEVLEPDRARAAGSRLLDRATFAFADRADLRIDLREQLDAAHKVVDAAAVGAESEVVAAGRRLVRVGSGPLLGGAAIGEWVDVHDDARRSAVLRAVNLAGPTALDAGHAMLAEDLARLGLLEDPWAERLHQLLVRSHLAQDDLDGARRAFRRALDALDDLGVRPERRTVELGRRLGHQDR